MKIEYFLGNNYGNSGKSDMNFDDDHELGELGDATDLSCDFGGDFGGF
jgi:hypothetical protein